MNYGNTNLYLIYFLYVVYYVYYTYFCIFFHIYMSFMSFVFVNALHVVSPRLAPRPAPRRLPSYLAWRSCQYTGFRYEALTALGRR